MFKFLKKTKKVEDVKTEDIEPYVYRFPVMSNDDDKFEEIYNIIKQNDIVFEDVRLNPHTYAAYILDKLYLYASYSMTKSGISLFVQVSVLENNHISFSLNFTNVNDKKLKMLVDQKVKKYINDKSNERNEKILKIIKNDK